MRWISMNNRYQIRNDIQGDGSYGAIRSEWKDGVRHVRKHKGIDWLCDTGEDGFAPFDDFTIIRRAYPYPEYYELEGFFWETDWCDGRVWYCKPDIKLIGKRIKLGGYVGEFQNVQIKYGPTIQIHYHFQIDNINQMRL